MITTKVYNNAFVALIAKTIRTKMCQKSKMTIKRSDTRPPDTASGYRSQNCSRTDRQKYGYTEADPRLKNKMDSGVK